VVAGRACRSASGQAQLRRWPCSGAGDAHRSSRAAAGPRCRPFHPSPVHRSRLTQVVDAFRASYGVENALYAVTQLAQVRAATFVPSACSASCPPPRSVHVSTTPAKPLSARSSQQNHVPPARFQSLPLAL
jgi:hypothetical protein